MKNKQEIMNISNVIGCDNVSSFGGHGKKTAKNAWNVLPELTDVLTQLSCLPSDIQDV